MERQGALEELSDHVVIFNCNEKVAKIVEELHTGTLPDPVDVVLVCRSIAMWEAHPKWHPRGGEGEGHFFVVEGNPTNQEDLLEVGTARARAAVILADPEQGELADARSTLVAMAIERQNPQVHTVMELIASQNRVHLKTTGVNEVVCLGELSEKLIAQSCITPGVKNIFHHLLSSREDTNQIFVRPLPPALAGLSYREIAGRFIRSSVPCILCGFGKLGASSSGAQKRRSFASRVFVVNPRAGGDPGKNTRLLEGDQLLVIAREPPELEEICSSIPAAAAHPPGGGGVPEDPPGP